MANRYSHNGKMPQAREKGIKAMSSSAHLNLASSSELIAELKRRGYRTFPESRVEELWAGWYVKFTGLEKKARMS